MVRIPRQRHTPEAAAARARTEAQAADLAASQASPRVRGRAGRALGTVGEDKRRAAAEPASSRRGWQEVGTIGWAARAVCAPRHQDQQCHDKALARVSVGASENQRDARARGAMLNGSNSQQGRGPHCRGLARRWQRPVTKSQSRYQSRDRPRCHPTRQKKERAAACHPFLAKLGLAAVVLALPGLASARSRRRSTTSPCARASRRRAQRRCRVSGTQCRLADYNR